MKFSDEHIYDAPVATIHKMFFDPGFVPKKYAELGYSDIEVIDSNKDEQNFHVTCRFKMLPTIQIPKFAQKFVRSDQPVEVVQTDRWDMSTNRGALEVDVKSLPGMTMHCDMELTEHPRGAVNRMQWTVKSSIPLVGKKLEQIMADDIQSKSAVDLDISKKLLQDY